MRNNFHSFSGQPRQSSSSKTLSFKGIAYDSTLLPLSLLQPDVSLQVLNDLMPHQALFFIDYKQKMLTRRYKEKQEEWFGKKGLPMCGVAVAFKGYVPLFSASLPSSWTSVLLPTESLRSVLSCFILFCVY
jgi:hypothetical protein